MKHLFIKSTFSCILITKASKSHLATITESTFHFLFICVKNWTACSVMLEYLGYFGLEICNSLLLRSPPGLTFTIHISSVFSFWHFLNFSRSLFLMVLSAWIETSIKAAPSCSSPTTDCVWLISQDIAAAPHIGRSGCSAASWLFISCHFHFPLLLFHHFIIRSIGHRSLTDCLTLSCMGEQILTDAAKFHNGTKTWDA